MVTVAVKDMQFIQPMFVYDVVSIFAEVEKIGNTSVIIKLAAYSARQYDQGIKNAHVAKAQFV